MSRDREKGLWKYIYVGYDMLIFIVKGGGVIYFLIGVLIDVNKYDYLICLYYFLLNWYYLIIVFFLKCVFWGCFVY